MPAEQYFAQRLAPDHPFSVRSYEQALKMAVQDKMEKSLTPGFDGEWVVRGPANVGARVNTIAVHPHDPDIIFIGYSSGGAFRTEDGGVNWRPVFDDQPFLSIGDIAFDPRQPEVVYIGTGDPNISGYPFVGDGLYRSADGGLTWAHLGLKDQRIISKVVVHPQDGQILYAATMGLPFVRNRQRGLYRSRDGGRSWVQILFVSEGAGIIDLIMDPRDPSVLYAVSWDRIRNNRETIVQGPNSRIYKSIDGGDNWTALGTGLPQGVTGRIALTISESNPQVLAALFVDEHDELRNIYRTEDAGRTWRSIIDPEGANGLPADPLGNLGWYFGRIAIHPQNDQEVFMLGVRLWRTKDNGRSWFLATAGSSNVHVDNHDLAFGPDGTIYLATDGGLYRSVNDGVSWQDAERISTTQFYRTAFNPHQPDRYYGGTQDNGTLGGFTELENWTRIFGADGFQPQFHPNRSEVFYVEIQGGGIYYTDAGGRGWQNGTSGIDGLDRRNWDAPYQISVHRPEVLYTGTFRMYKSVSNGAPKWRPISGDLTRGDVWGFRFNTISALHESPADSSLLYVGTTDGLVWRTDNGGRDWRSIAGGLPDRYVTSIKASPLNPDFVAVTHSGYRDNDFVPHVHLSTDRGENWISIAGNLPPLGVNDLYVLPGTSDEILLAATDGGVYATTNQGLHWMRLGVNMPIVPVYDLEWNPVRNELIAATFGRSIQSYPLDELLAYWRNTVAVDAATATVFSPNIYPNPAREWLNIVNLASHPTGVVIYNNAGRLVLRRRYLPAPNLEIALTGWPSGLYFIVIEQNGKRSMSAFVKL